MHRNLKDLIILIKSGGEVASAVAHKLARCHFRVCLTEVAQPVAVSRGVAFCEAIYDGQKEVEGMIASLVTSAEQIALGIDVKAAEERMRSAIQEGEIQDLRNRVEQLEMERAAKP